MFWLVDGKESIFPKADAPLSLVRKLFRLMRIRNEGKLVVSEDFEIIFTFGFAA